MSDPDRIVKRSVGGVLSPGVKFRVLIRNEVNIVVELHGKELPPMHPDTALAMAIGLNYAARLVKQRTGMKPVMHGIAELTDKVADDRRIQKARDTTAVFSKN